MPEAREIIANEILKYKAGVVSYFDTLILADSIIKALRDRYGKEGILSDREIEDIFHKLAGMTSRMTVFDQLYGRKVAQAQYLTDNAVKLLPVKTGINIEANRFSTPVNEDIGKVVKQARKEERERLIDTCIKLTDYLDKKNRKVMVILLDTLKKEGSNGL